MSIDPLLVVTCFGIGIVVGLTGMGGGALMTPALVLFFNVPPLAAVSSDLAASAVMKPVGSLVHLKQRTVNLELVKWLCIGSVPASFAGVFIIKSFGENDAIQAFTERALGAALLVAALGLVVRAYIRLAERARVRDGLLPPLPRERPDVVAHPWRTLLIGVIGGVIVGMTSVGSGSLIIIALMLVYPTLKANQLVGTDLVQSVPLAASAALAHVLFGDFQLGLTTSLLIGSIPGVWVGAQLSSRAPGGLVRRALAFVLLASSLKMFGVPTSTTAYALGAVLLVAPVTWMVVRRHHGFPALARGRAAPTAGGG